MQPCVACARAEIVHRVHVGTMTDPLPECLVCYVRAHPLDADNAVVNALMEKVPSNINTPCPLCGMHYHPANQLVRLDTTGAVRKAMGVTWESETTDPSELEARDRCISECVALEFDVRKQVELGAVFALFPSLGYLRMVRQPTQFTIIPRTVEWLDVSCSDITDLRIFSRMTRLTSLTFRATHVPTFQGLEVHSHTLRFIDAEYSMMRSLQLIGTFSHLRTLRMSDTLLSSIEELRQCTELEHLSIARTNVTDIGPLVSCPVLRTLDISSTKVTCIEALRNAMNLGELQMNQTAVATLDPLTHHKSLCVLSLSCTPVDSIAPIVDCTTLMRLDISCTQVKSVGALGTCPLLVSLTVRGSLVSPRSIFYLRSLGYSGVIID